MNKHLAFISFIFFTTFCFSQNDNLNKQDITVLNQIVENTCLCFNENSNKSEGYLEKLLLRECLEESSEKNLNELLKHYKIKSFQEMDITKYLEDLKEELTKECKSKKEFIVEAFKLISVN